MHRRLLLISILLIQAVHGLGQVSIPFAFVSEDDNKLIRENDSVKFFVATGDTSNIVCINEEAAYYKLYNKNLKLLVEGGFIMDGDKYLCEGKWIEHYTDGKVKMAGYYKRNKPIGTWQEFYPNGKVMDIYNYAIFIENGDLTSCLSGSYQEFYENGKLKINGFYSASLVDAAENITVSDPVTGNAAVATTHKSDFHNAKIGRWEYYKENGELDRKEDY